VMVVREILEADQYVRNNSPTFSWELFQQLLTPDSQITEEDFHRFNHILVEKNRSSFVRFDLTIYRFATQTNELVYIAEWKELDGELKLHSLSYIK
jgi:hypothetical protein